MTTAEREAIAAAPGALPPLRTKALSDAIGLEALDVDLREPLSPGRVVQLRQASHQGLILSCATRA